MPRRPVKPPRQMRRESEQEEFRFRASRTRAAVGQARRRLRQWLESYGFDPRVAADITLACSEACANAIEHPVRPTRQAFEVRGRRTDDGIELRVRDFGTWRPESADPTHGRGLRMIRRLMDSTEIETGDHETTVVMRRARRSV